MDKTLSLAACLLFATALGPVASAHDDSGFRYPAGSVINGVNGAYQGPAAGGYFSVKTGLGTSTHADGVMLCDQEVGGDGSGPQPVDEAVVDGAFTGGLVLDGVHDDGGLGGACHTNHYAHAPYNTPGCIDDGARANDAAFAGDVWIAAACDWKAHLVAGQPLPCSVAHQKDDKLPGTVQCLDDPVRRMADCTVVACTQSCGADGVSDAAKFGKGGTRVPYPHGAFNAEPLACPQADATMQAYVLTAVVVDLTVLPPVVTVYPATAGVIWQVP